MKITKLELENFRNIERLTMEPGEQVNIIHGSNAQGKTNLLEAVWLFTGMRSFRGSRDAEMVRKDSAGFKINAEYFYDNMEQAGSLSFFEKKQATQNGVTLGSGTELGERFKAVVFAPSHLSMVEDGPAVRRKFIDSAIFQIRPVYAKILLEYSRSVTQRNAVLKDVSSHSELYDMLEAFEAGIAVNGAKIMDFRRRYADKISTLAYEFYQGISKGREELFVSYSPSLCVTGKTPGEIYPQLLEALKSSRAEDMISGVTGIGPHRDEFSITIGELSAREYASQGQKRSSVLALKLSEAEVLRQSFDESPVILLDDVLSELDKTRQDYILNRLEGWQVFVTCCDPKQAARVTKGRTFKMENGELKIENKGTP